MRESQSKTIDGLTFTVGQLPAMRAVKLMHRLARAVGPAMLKSLAGANVASVKDIANLDLNLGDAADGVAMMFDKFTENDLEALIRELFETATVVHNGNTVPLMPVFDHVMQGRAGTVMKAVKFALEVNYQDFLGALLAQVAGAKG